MRISKPKKKPSQKVTSFKSEASGRSYSWHEREVNAILNAQRIIGNRNVLQLLRSYDAKHEARESTNLHPSYTYAYNRKPMHIHAPTIQRDTSASSPYRQRVIASKSYKLYLRDITHFHPDTRFINNVRTKWLRILNAYCAGYLTDTKYITRSDMKYNQQSDFDRTIKNMLDITWQNGDNPKILADKLNRLDVELNASKEFMKKMTQPSGFVGKSWVRDFHKKRHIDNTSFMKAGSWTHTFSWLKWLGF